MLNAPDEAPEVLAEDLIDLSGVTVDRDGQVWAAEGLPGQLVQVGAGQLKRISVGGVPRGIVADGAGRIWFCDAADRSIRRFDPSDGQVRTICSSIYHEPLNDPIGLAFDALGNLLFVCRSERQSVKEGYVCCLARNGHKAEMIANELSSPTHVVVVHHGATLLVLESGSGQILRGEWDGEQELWGEEDVWATSLTLSPWATAAMGIDGHLYVGSGDRLCALASNGLLTSQREMPGMEIVSIAFDPLGEKGLIVADAKGGKLIQMKWLGPGPQPGESGEKWL